MRTTVEIDHEIVKIRTAITKLEKEKAKNVEALERAKAARQELAWTAVSDAKANAELKRVHEDQRALELKIEDGNFAIDTARREMDKLNNERLESLRAEKAVEFSKVGKSALTQSRELDAALDGIAALLAKHNDTLKQLTQIGGEVGQRRAFQLNVFLRCLLGRFHRSFPRDFSCHSHYKDGIYERHLQTIIDNDTKLIEGAANSDSAEQAVND